MIDSSFAVRGSLLFGTHLEPGTLVVSNGVIERVVRGQESAGNLPPTVLDAEIVAPGMVDLQVNGAVGVEVDDDPAHIDQVSEWLASTGVTAWLPTVVTAGAAFYPAIFDTWRHIRSDKGAVPLGLHLEGPFLAPARKGAHQLRYIEAADDDLFASWLDEPSIRLVTLAPERHGGIDRIRQLVSRGVIVSLGHTDATFEQFEAGVDAGATKATHLFNAMSPIHHRQPGAMTAVMTDDRVTTGLIPDAVHAHPAMVRLATRAKEPDRIAIVSDMMAAAGLGDGVYELGGQKVFVEGDRAQLADGTLAGSMLTMDQAVRNCVAWADVTAGETLHMCTAVPASVLGEASRGRLVVGARADITLWNRGLELDATLVGGSTVWSRT
jgi:N-acetylglucosamine-6-phosphate deacetylase